MIKGIGVDIVSLNRIHLKIASKILSPLEKEVFGVINNKERKIEYLAGRFAAKEAYFKASNTKETFVSISVLNDDAGKPYIKDKKEVNLSISHEKDYLIAFVVIE